MTDFPRSLADAAGAADGLTPVAAEPRSLADDAAASDVVGRGALGSPRALADSAAAGDVLGGPGGHPRILASAAAAVDAMTRTTLAGVGPLSASRARSGTVSVGSYAGVGSLSASRGRGGFCVPQGFNGTSRQIRWRLDDPTDGHSGTFEINPSAGGSPHYKRNVTSTPTTAADGVTLHFQGDDDLPTSSFTVVTRTQAAYDALQDWYRRCRTHPLLLTDDLGRRAYIVFSKQSPARKPGSRHNFRHEWAVDYYIWAEVSV